MTYPSRLLLKLALTHWERETDLFLQSHSFGVRLQTILIFLCIAVLLLKELRTFCIRDNYFMTYPKSKKRSDELQTLKSLDLRELWCFKMFNTMKRVCVTSIYTYDSSIILKKIWMQRLKTWSDCNKKKFFLVLIGICILRSLAENCKTSVDTALPNTWTFFLHKFYNRIFLTETGMSLQRTIFINSTKWYMKWKQHFFTALLDIFNVLYWRFFKNNNWKKTKQKSWHKGLFE